jgi:hypothetical protein
MKSVQWCAGLCDRAVTSSNHQVLNMYHNHFLVGSSAPHNPQLHHQTALYDYVTRLLIKEARLLFVLRSKYVYDDVIL